MNWDAIGSIGEIVGAIGVIVSLIYVATQIRQNSAWLKSTVVESAGTRTGDLTGTVYSDPDLSRIVTTAMTQNAESLTREEKLRFTLVLTRIMRNQEINFVHYQSGLLDDVSYEGFIRNMSAFTSSPLFDEWWEATSEIFRADFRAKVEEVRKNFSGLEYDFYREQNSSEK